MKPGKKLLPYLLLNIFVSALTTLLVLWVWESMHTIQMPEFSPEELSQLPGVAQTLEPTLPPVPPLDQRLIQIQNVFGTGDIQNEVVTLSRSGEGELWLTGWQLQDQSNHTFTFPALMLNKDGGIQVYTCPGDNSVIELHWGLDEAVWQVGEAVTLLDPMGNARDIFVIP